MEDDIDSMDINFLNFSSCCQGEVQPLNSHRLGLFQNGHLIQHNLQAHEKHSREACTVIARTVICCNQEMYPQKALATGLKTSDQSMPCSPWLRDTRSCGKRVWLGLIHKTDTKTSFDALTVMCFNHEMYPRKALATGLKTSDESLPCSPGLRDTRSRGKRV